MTNATEEQKKQLVSLIKNGQLAPFPKREWLELTQEHARKYATQGENTAPMSFKPVSQSQKTRLKSLAEAELIEMRAEDFKHLSSTDADILTELAIEANNREKRPRNILKKIHADEAPASRTQKAQIKKLVTEGFLKPVSPETWISLPRINARKIIMAGCNNKKHNKHC